MSFPVVDLARHIVAMVFVSPSPLDVDTVARVLRVPRSDAAEAINFLRDHPPIGLMVQRSGDQLELVSDPSSGSYIEELLGLNRPVKLSRAALETLAIVAYRQPVTRGDVEAIRGVNSDSAITTLMNRGLVEEAGRKEAAGRPALYATTPEFLQHLGIHSLDALPPVDPAPRIG